MGQGIEGITYTKWKERLAKSQLAKFFDLEVPNL